MHCIQYIATQADNVQEAFDGVKHQLEANMGDEYNLSSWYDWFVTGGGRWASNDDAQYDDEFTGDVVHQDDPKFQEYLDTAHKYRLVELDKYINLTKEISLSDIIDRLGDFEHDHLKVGMDLYPIHKLYELAMGVWDYTSYFYDTVHDSSNRRYMLEAIDKGDKNWYLVPVDFHF